MELLFPGALVRRERLRRGWSQEGLCRGICAVSYLSKIEQGKAEASGELLRLYPCAYLYLKAGIDAYEQGGSYAAALEHLHRAYELAAEEGCARIMLMAKLYMGNCYCNKVDLANMEVQYRVAGRPAHTLEEEGLLRDVRYKRAAAQLEAGDAASAYAWFAAIKEPSAMELHKLAICCEKLGRRTEALAALDRAEKLAADIPDGQLAAQMCAVVRFRLEHPDYLQSPQYGERLLTLFARCRKELPVGYASFHLPWVLEWHTAARQYRAAYELLRNFPIKPQSMQ